LRKTAVLRWQAGKFSRSRPDSLAVEEPLELRLSWGPPEQAQTRSLITTLRTPGADYELALGWLFSEGLIQSAQDVVKMTYCLGKNKLEQQYNILQIRLQPGLLPDLSRMERSSVSHGGCGLCGKREIEQLQQHLKPDFTSDFPAVQPELILNLPLQARPLQALFERSGGVHAAALFNLSGELLSLQEDIGRHNAVDKLIGAALIAGQVPLREQILFLSGRAGFELIQKSLQASLPIVVSVGAPSSLALELAQSYGQTLIGFLREEGFNLYSGQERLQLIE